MKNNWKQSLCCKKCQDYPKSPFELNCCNILLCEKCIKRIAI